MGHSAIPQPNALGQSDFGISYSIFWHKSFQSTITLQTLSHPYDIASHLFHHPKIVPYSCDTQPLAQTTK